LETNRRKRQNYTITISSIIKSTTNIVITTIVLVERLIAVINSEAIPVDGFKSFFLVVLKLLLRHRIRKL